MNRKYTAWKKNRRLGDVAGGRRTPKFEDHIIRREHSLKLPARGQETPILIEESPSRDFFFPVCSEDVLAYIRSLPTQDVSGITHIWLRCRKSRESLVAHRPLAEYVWGSGVRAIVLYPWPRDCMLRFSKRRPSARTLRAYSRWTRDLIRYRGVWCLRWSEQALHDFYLRGLVAHEVGHHRDPHRRSQANARRQEETAEQYALERTPAGEAFSSFQDEI
jgi:hypothetical protein